MPLPQPTAGEKQNDFISRCISFETKASPGRDPKQIQAMCYTAWRKAKGIKGSEENMPNIKIALFSDKGEYDKLNIKLSGIKLWRKHILSLGKWKHPENRDIEFEVTPEVVQQVVNNFYGGVPDEAPVVLTHSDNPKAKVGNVKSFIATENGLDAILSVADEEINEKIISSEAAPGVSCWLDLNYEDKQTGEKLGAVVRHVALVNHPYIDKLGEFQAVSLSEDKDAEKFVPLILSENKTNIGDKKMLKKDKAVEITKEEALKFLKDKEKIDVAALLSAQEDLKVLSDRIDKGELVEKSDATLSADLIAEIKKSLKLGDDAKKTGEIVKQLLDKFVETGELKTTVETMRGELSEMKADKEVEVLLTEGRAFPAEKDVLKSLYKTDFKLFEKMVTARKSVDPIVKLSESGVTLADIKTKQEKTEAELEKQTKAAKEEGYIAEK